MENWDGQEHGIDDLVIKGLMGFAILYLVISIISNNL